VNTLLAGDLCEILNMSRNSVESHTLQVDDNPSLVGTRLRRLRDVYGMSQRELARQAGVTNGAISMIEQDRVSPSIASLKKILGAFGLSLSDFFADEFKLDSQIFYRADELTLISDGPVILRQLGANMSNRNLQVLHETYVGGGETGADLLTHDGEEAGIVVRGQIEITVGGQREVLSRGDGYYFSSRIPHRFQNIGADECEIVSVCTPPTF
jgi:transcriptional regulator with XRE-family HTH domain